jgi:excisionase family DNA binding protein
MLLLSLCYAKDKALCPFIQQKINEMDLIQIDTRLEAIEKALSENKTVFTPKEAAKYIGISQSTLYKMTSAGILPFSKPNGKLIYFSKAGLDRWLLSNGTKSGEQKESEASTYITTHQ